MYEIASALLGAGAEHNFLRKTFPDVPALAFAVGLLIAVHGAATLATVALTFGNYTQTFLSVEPTVIAIGLMAVARAINVWGIGKASFVSATLTVFQVCCLIGFALFAISTGPRTDGFNVAFKGLSEVEKLSKQRLLLSLFGIGVIVIAARSLTFGFLAVARFIGIS